MKYNTLKRLEKLESAYQATVEDKRFRQAQEEVKAIVDALTERYNSPEEKAKRKAEYEEICRIGELRREAFRRGEDMDQYPLPWEKDKDSDEDSWIQRIMDEIEREGRHFRG